MTKTSIDFERRRALGVAGGALCTAAGVAGTPARAQSSTPLRVILPVGPGSGIDTIIRTASPALSKALGGQPVVVENQAGAGGIIGAQTLAKAAPDGTTIGVLSNNHVVLPSVYPKTPYDTLGDFTYVSVLGASPFLLLVNPNKLPAKNARELQALLKAAPGKFNYGSSGNGTIIHLAAEMYADAAGVEIRHVPYKGFGPMLADLISGQIDLGVGAVPAVQGQLKAGSVRALGVMGKQRVASLPDLPTVAEQGFPDVDVGGWLVVAGPAKLPAAQVARLHDAFVAAFADPEVKAAMLKQDNQIDPGAPDAATAFVKAEQERYARLVKKAGVRMD